MGAVEARRGVLLGSHRPGWVDAVRFCAAPAGAWRELIERRFRPHRALEPVGIVLTGGEVRRLGAVLARELVPGDVVLAVPVKSGRPVAYVNRGDRLARARLKISRVA